MIVNKTDRSYQTRSDASNFNWLKSDDWYIVDDNSELAKKIIRLYPRFDFILDENGELVDVEETPKTQEEIKLEKETAIKIRLARLDETINRPTEDLYELTNTTPYEAVQKVIKEKKELRGELQKITGGDSIGI